MTMESELIPNDLAQIIGYILMIGTIMVLSVFSNKHGKTIIQELKGDNNKWDAPELAIVIWLILFPVMIIADVFIQYHASQSAWYSMDLILLFILAGKVGLEHVRKPKSDSNKSEAL
jgi:hypothetical protein